MSKVLKQTHTINGDDDGDDEYVTPENEPLNLWNIFQHFFCINVKNTVKPLWDEHDNK